jgi:hypothetical protein
VPRPSINEQNLIVDRIGEIFSSESKSKEKYLVSKALQKSIINQVF